MSKASRRYYRSLILSIVALGVLVWVALDQFGVPWRDALALIGGTLSVVIATILVAALVAGLWIAVRKWLGRGDRQ